MVFMAFLLFLAFPAYADFVPGTAGNPVEFPNGLTVTGEVEYPNVGFIARGLTSGVAHNGVEVTTTILNYNTPVFDSHSGLNVGTGAYTIPAGYTGAWRFAGNCQLHANQVYVRVRMEPSISINGVRHLWQQNHHMGDSHDNPDAPYVSIEGILFANAGDSIIFNFLRRDISGASYTTHTPAERCWFTGTFLGN